MKLPATLPILALALASPVLAGDQANQTATTPWVLKNNVPLSTVQDVIADGFRIVDIEVESVSPMRYSGVFVENEGSYEKLFRWDTDATEADFDLAMIQGWRFVDVEPYRDANDDLRFAYVAIPNAGSDAAVNHGVAIGLRANEVDDWFDTNWNYRMTDLQVTRRNGTSYYTFCWVQNSGPLYSQWWYRLGLVVDALDGYLSDRDARLVDFEPHSGTVYCSLLAVPSNGEPSLLDAPFTQLTWDEVQGLSGSWGCRPTDFERYSFQGNTRYALVLRQNENDLAFDTAYRMRSELTGPAGLDHGSKSGLLLREFNGAHSTVAAANERRTMRPGGLLRVAHHYTALRKVALGQESAIASVDVEFDGGGCPSGGPTIPVPFLQALRSMMEGADEFAVDAFRRRYGEGEIESFAASAGAPSVDLNGVLGCGGDATSTATLRDIADLFGAVADGDLGAFEDEFFELMSNTLGTPGNLHSWVDTVDDMLADSTLSPLDRAAFKNGVEAAWAGNIGSNFGGDRATGAHFSIPFRDGCELVRRRYFIGAWVNGAHDSGDARDARNFATDRLLASVLADAIESWEDAGPCLGWQDYGIPSINSGSLRGTIAGSGSRYVLENDLVLHAAGIPAGSVGMLLVSPEQGFTANPGGSAGNLLLGGPIGRDLGSIQVVGSTGTFRRPFDLNAVPTPTGPEAARGGDTLNFQWWYRDVDPSTGAQTSNFTNGLEVHLL